MARYMRIDERGRNLLLDARGKLIHDYSLPPDQQPLYFPDARIVAGESSYEVRDALARMSPNDQAVLERVLVPKEGGCRVIASSQPPENGAGEPGRTVVGGDAWALAHLSYLMGMLRDEGGARDLALQYADDGPTSEWKEWHDCNLYLIGGPVLNAATRQVIDKVGSDAPHTLRYSFREHTIIDLETGDEVVGDARFFD